MEKESAFGQIWKQITIEFDNEQDKLQYKIENKIKEYDIEAETETKLIITKKRVNEFVRIKQASELTGLKETYIRNLAGKGEIPSYKQGKFLVFRPEELKEWVNKRTEKR